MKNLMFENQRWLICQPMFLEINGSTTLSLELAEYLISQGAQVWVYSYAVGNPIENIAVKKGITIIKSVNFKADNFDYIWSNSQTLPRFIVEKLDTLSDKMNPIFLFAHLSSLKQAAPDEFPYILGLEERLASKSVFVSREALSVQKSFFTKMPDASLFENPAPIKFSKYPTNSRSKLTKVLMVSNHSNSELQDAKELLEKKGIEVVQFGQSHEKYQLIEPELLADFDAVITIGKTVQYCLVQGIPVYVYAHFSGDGYLTPENFDENRQNNFSGRKRGTNWDYIPHERKTGSQIADELISGYKNALEFHTANRNKWIEEFSIDYVLPNLMKTVVAKRNGRFSSSEVLNLIEMQTFSKRSFGHMMELWRTKREIKLLQSQIKALKNEKDS
ncbi:hypothetical protein [Lactococcus lactis]|uniref:hypothetical protein n=1 Tax=Lactococcus lactis TaxID=1358 RepID=UPI0020745226|nr:hypothetical protein [Lactococcus lactis]